MAPKSSPFIFVISLILTSVLCTPALTARADNTGVGENALPSLTEFTERLENGQGNQLRGIYARGLFADKVIQQPAGAFGFVSSEQGTLTQFGAATQFGATGLLAHSYLEGGKFASLQEGQLLYLVYGDGHTETYIVSRQLAFQALQPNSDYSAFRDLQGGARVSASALFSQIYNRNGALILQTCIEKDGIPSWGRLFVIAQPYLTLVGRTQLAIPV